jgi:hypothetical protein
MIFWGNNLGDNMHRLWKILTEAADDSPEPVLCLLTLKMKLIRKIETSSSTR